MPTEGGIHRILELVGLDYMPAHMQTQWPLLMAFIYLLGLTKGHRKNKIHGNTNSDFFLSRENYPRTRLVIDSIAQSQGHVMQNQKVPQVITLAFIFHLFFKVGNWFCCWHFPYQLLWVWQEHQQTHQLSTLGFTATLVWYLI